ncbi:MAG: DUF4360 domain-containing protein [Thiothrix sp.]|nr:DUF4360 domain-containing protein [Thiothrix sp.]HPQ97754.1 DUF4360 domain-containing protein [Thiolinea sp.]
MKTPTHRLSAFLLGALLSMLSPLAPATENPATGNSDRIHFKGLLAMAGTGCPANTPEPSGVGTTDLELRFRHYDAGKGSGTDLERSACSFALPVHVPQGMQVSVMTTDWVVYVRGKAQLSRKYFFAGAPEQPWQRNDYDSARGEYFTEHDTPLTATAAWTPCGQDVTLRINSNIRVRNSDSYIAVHPVGSSIPPDQGRIRFTLMARACQ